MCLHLLKQSTASHMIYRGRRMALKIRAFHKPWFWCLSGQVLRGFGGASLIVSAPRRPLLRPKGHIRLNTYIQTHYLGYKTYELSISLLYLSSCLEGSPRPLVRPEGTKRATGFRLSVCPCLTTNKSPPTPTITAPVWHIFQGCTYRTALWSPQNMSYGWLCSGGGGGNVLNVRPSVCPSVCGRGGRCSGNRV